MRGLILMWGLLRVGGVACERYVALYVVFTGGCG